MTKTLPENEGDQIQVGDISNGRAIAIGQGATAIYQGLTPEEVAVLLVELKRVDQPTVWDGRTPYIGLTAFQESDAQFFFGRESLVDDMLERVQKASFIVVAGPSGSGKSSVARAGLFHALRDGRLEKSNSWLLATMQPGGNPLEQLALAIERAVKTPGVGNHIRGVGLENRLALSEQMESLLSDDPRQRFVVLVDQFEETFTQTTDEAVRVAFINLLISAAQAPASRAIILLALRADFVSHCARYPELRTLMSQQFQLVGAMDPRDLAKAITLPALEVGAAIDPALVSRIMADMKGEPGALPLMSFALRDLFEVEKTEKGEPMDLTLPEYLRRGGIESALERHANQVFANFSQTQKDLAKTIFSRLIEVGQGRQDTRRTATIVELVPAGQDAEEVTDVINALAAEQARLITTSGTHNQEETVEQIAAQTTVTIAHEKLIDAWPWLRRLVDENRELISLQNQIDLDAHAWATLQDVGYMYRGGRLVLVEEKLAELQPNLSKLSQQFIQASLNARGVQNLSAKELQQQIEHEQAIIQRLEELKAKKFILRAGLKNRLMTENEMEVTYILRKAPMRSLGYQSIMLVAMIIALFIYVSICYISFYLMGLASQIKNEDISANVTILICGFVFFFPGLLGFLLVLLWGWLVPSIIKPELERRIQSHKESISQLERALEQVR